MSAEENYKVFKDMIEIIITLLNESRISKYVKDTGLNYKNYQLPHGAGVCKVTWPEGKLNFEWS